MANSEHWVFNSQTGQYDLQNDNGVIQTTIRFVSDDISVFDGAIEDLENSGMYTNVPMIYMDKCNVCWFFGMRPSIIPMTD